MEVSRLAKPSNNEDGFMAQSEAGRLHERDEQHFKGGQLYSMLDIMGASLTCDFCGRWQRIPAISHSEARARSVALGWTSRGGKDCCRVCEQTKPGDETLTRTEGRTR